MKVIFMFRGRLGRDSFWLLAIVVGFFPVMSLPVVDAFFDGMIDLNADRPEAWTLDWLRPLAMGATVIVSALLMIMISVPRRRDRDASGLDAILFFVFGTVVILSDVDYPLLRRAFEILFGASALFLLIVQGFLKGTTGPNRYGLPLRNMTVEEERLSKFH